MFTKGLCVHVSLTQCWHIRQSLTLGLALAGSLDWPTPPSWSLGSSSPQWARPCTPGFVCRPWTWTPTLSHRTQTYAPATGYSSDLCCSDRGCIFPLMIHAMGNECDELCHPCVGHEGYRELTLKKCLSPSIALPYTASILSCSHSIKICSFFSLNAFQVLGRTCLI